MPSRAEGQMPKLLSETGAFQQTSNVVPSKSLIPYDLNISFWSLKITSVPGTTVSSSDV